MLGCFELSLNFEVESFKIIASDWRMVGDLLAKVAEVGRH